MLIEYFFIGLVVGFLFYEFFDISPGGVIAPAYLALFIYQPQQIVMTVILALLVWGIILFLSRWFIIYGRRRLMLALLVGFCLKLVLKNWIQPISFLNVDLSSIGYIIPGLIANEMIRQKLLPTLTSLGIVTILIYLIILLIR